MRFNAAQDCAAHIDHLPTLAFKHGEGCAPKVMKAMKKKAAMRAAALVAMKAMRKKTGALSCSP